MWNKKGNSDASDGNNPYIKKWKAKLIQTGLQKDNSLSSILYLNELYKINVVIYNSETDEYYATTLKKMSFNLTYIERPIYPIRKQHIITNKRWRERFDSNYK